MKATKLPSKYVLTISKEIDEEPSILLSKKEFPFLSWALKELASSFENDLKSFKARHGDFPDTDELIFDETVQLSYETSPYCHKYFTVQPIKK